MRTFRLIALTVASTVGVVALSAGSASATRVQVPKPRCNDISLNTGHLPGGRDIDDLTNPYEYDADLFSSSYSVSSFTAELGTKASTGKGKKTDKAKTGVKRKYRYAVGGPVKRHFGVPVQPQS